MIRFLADAGTGVRGKNRPKESKGGAFRPYETLPTLVNRVAEKIVAIGNEDYAALGLNVRGARVMLAFHGNDSLRVYEILQRCGIEASTVSHLLNRLVRLGYVTRTRLEEDNRAVVVCLTPVGRKIVDRCAAVVARHHALLAKSLTSREAATLRELCLKLNRSLMGAGTSTHPDDVANDKRDWMKQASRQR